ncbi:hypothetical protein R0J90_03245 [Micrococcus sp. SIMBA_144]
MRALSFRDIMSPAVIFAICLCSFIIGWIVAAWIDYGNSGFFSSEAFETMGAWVGGVGIASAAFIWTIWESHQRLRERRRKAYQQALLCTARVKADGFGHQNFKIIISFKNTSNVALSDVHLRFQLEKYGPVCRFERIITPTNEMTISFRLSEFQELVELASREARKREFRDKIKSRVDVQYTVDEFRFIRQVDEVSLINGAGLANFGIPTVPLKATREHGRVCALRRKGSRPMQDTASGTDGRIGDI